MTRLLMAFIGAYRLLLSPWLGSSCRFTPSCSAYAMGCLEQYGAATGSYLTAKRLLRCQPWCQGGHDPVPDKAPNLFLALLSSTPSVGSPKKSS